MNGRVDRAELISKLKTLAGLTDEERSRLIGLLREHKKYGLVWEDKPEDAERLLEEQLPVLREVAEKRIPSLPSPNKTFPNHILIEGDNLHALTALSYTHAGKIDVIYIDPPYNTGNKDFAYYDDFNDDYRKIPYVEREDAYRHSKWLSFMKRRLKIAKKLLSDKGVIFISIDDNEQANLKLLCDEIMGFQNFVSSLIWKSKSGGANDSSAFGVDHEYILCYAKNINEISLNNDKNAVATTSYNKVDSNGKRYALDRLDKQSLGYVASLDFPIIGPDGKEYIVEHKDPNHKKARWRWGKETVKERYDELVFIFPYVYTKNYEKENGQKPRSILFDERFGRTRTGSTDLAAVIGKQSLFSYPKPVSLLKFIQDIASRKDSTILDFFAGSGTTLHATMQLNAEDGGHRQCILVTNNENNICEEVTYVRNKKVIEGYTTPKGVAVAGLKENNLRYYKTEFIPRDRTVKNMRRLVEAATDMLCIKENIYQEQKAFATLPYNNNVYRYYEENGHNMLIIYQEEFIPVIVEAIKAVPREKWEKTLKVYVFSPDRDPYADEFFEVEDRVELCALPDAIYDAYTQVLPRWKDKAIEVNEEQVATEENEWEV